LWTDNDHDTVALGLLERLCQVLDLHPTELFRTPARVKHRRSRSANSEPADGAVIAAALANLTSPLGRSGPAVSSARLAAALGWTLGRLDDALAALDEHLADTGVRIDHDPAPPSPPPIRGLRARDCNPSQAQRIALYQLHQPDPVLDVETARVLEAIAHAPRTVTERVQSFDPAAVVARHHSHFGVAPHSLSGPSPNNEQQ
jgi:hypothetical protein